MPTKRSKGRSLSTQERIRASAVALFAEKGFHATGIREIADLSGIAISSLYSYMDSKEELLAEIMIANIETVSTAAEICLSRATTPAQELAVLVRSHVLCQLEAPLEASVSDYELRALGPDILAKVLKERDAYEDLWRGCITTGVRKGVFSLSNLSVSRTVLIEACNGVVRWYSPNGALTPTAVADVFVEQALRLVSATKAGKAMDLHDVGEPSSDEILLTVHDVFGKRYSSEDS